MLALFLPSRFIFLCISVLSVFSISAKVYSPQLRLDYKRGKRRILRGSALIPAWQRVDKLLYGAVIGMYDFAPLNEFNIVIGYRQNLQTKFPMLLGGYAFYDRSHSKKYKNFNQLTLGLELLSFFGEFRLVRSFKNICTLI